MNNTKINKVLKWVGILLFIVLIMAFSGWDYKIYGPILLIVLALHSIEKRLLCLEQKVNLSSSLSGITQIETFSMKFNAIFLDKLKEKCSFDSETLKRAEKQIYHNSFIKIKIEHHSSGLIRLKKWHSQGDNRVHYSEEDNLGNLRSVILYRLVLGDLCSKENKPEDYETLTCTWNYDWGNQEIKVYLMGGRFGGCDLPDGEDMPEEKNILFQLKLKDLKELDKYHKSNFKECLDILSPFYYSPSKVIREYGNLFIHEDKSGITWDLQLFDVWGVTSNWWEKPRTSNIRHP